MTRIGRVINKPQDAKRPSLSKNMKIKCVATPKTLLLSGIPEDDIPYFQGKTFRVKKEDVFTDIPIQLNFRRKDTTKDYWSLSLEPTKLIIVK